MSGKGKQLFSHLQIMQVFISPRAPQCEALFLESKLSYPMAGTGETDT
jgi:hypothetical protein